MGWGLALGMHLGCMAQRVEPRMHSTGKAGNKGSIAQRGEPKRWTKSNKYLFECAQLDSICVGCRQYLESYILHPIPHSLQTAPSLVPKPCVLTLFESSMLCLKLGCMHCTAQGTFVFHEGENNSLQACPGSNPRLPAPKPPYCKLS